MIVKHGADYWVCRKDPTGWRCGQCRRGLLREKINDKCRVCRSVVYRIDKFFHEPAADRMRRKGYFRADWPAE